jgi:signal peptidase I
MTLAILIFAISLVAGLALSALWLWLTCIVFRARRATVEPPGPRRIPFRRALSLTVVTSIVSVTPFAVRAWSAGGMPDEDSLAAIGLGSGFLIFAYLLVWKGLPTSALKAIPITLVWQVMVLVSGFGLLMGVWLFVAEAFIFPTGSMADTFYGYHRQVSCPQCGHTFAANASMEAPQEDAARVVEAAGCTCPNCRAEIGFTGRYQGHDRVLIPTPDLCGGDRILAAKGLGRKVEGPLARFDLAVFRFVPHDPRYGPPTTYMKRVIGLPGDTIAIHAGKLYLLPSDDDLKYPDAPTPPGDPELPVGPEFMMIDNAAARARFEAGRFRILRKSPEQILARRHIVYDNDHPASDLEVARWQPADGWKDDGDHGFRCALTDERTHALTYRHILRGSKDPQLIDDFSGYNSSLVGFRQDGGRNWAGDLLLECEAVVDKAEGALVLELRGGGDKFRARWDLRSGDCELLRMRRVMVDGHETLEPEPLGTKGTPIQKPGVYRLRFANFENRLTVWVDDQLIFGDGVEYVVRGARGPRKSDLGPATISAKAASLRVQKIKLWRDTYYTLAPGRPDTEASETDWRDPDAWRDKELPFRTFYVQPGHYFFLGDNSPASADSRVWGLIPEARLVGKVLCRYWPWDRIGRVR